MRILKRYIPLAERTVVVVVVCAKVSPKNAVIYHVHKKYYTKNKKGSIMGMNVNRGWFSFKNNWKEQIKFNPQRETQKLEAEPLKPGMQPKRQTPTQTDIQQLLNNLDNPDIPKFN